MNQAESGTKHRRIAVWSLHSRTQLLSTNSKPYAVCHDAYLAASGPDGPLSKNDDRTRAFPMQASKAKGTVTMECSCGGKEVPAWDSVFNEGTVQYRGRPPHLRPNHLTKYWYSGASEHRVEKTSILKDIPANPLPNLQASERAQHSPSVSIDTRSLHRVPMPKPSCQRLVNRRGQRSELLAER